MREEKIIELLKSRLDSINQIQNGQMFNQWKGRTIQTLAHIYGESHTCVKALNNIHGFHYVDRVLQAKSEASELIKGLIENVEFFGVDSITKGNTDKKSDQLSVNVSQNNNQNQSTNITFNLELFVEAVKDELKGGQVKELKAILDSDEEPEQKKKSFIDKLKSFGSDLASNILANVMTNPQVYDQIGGLL